jgi:hypothetical protein
MRRATAATQLALWVGRKGRGSVHLRWDQRELTLFINALQVVGVQGDDRDRLSAGLGLTQGGEWFARAAEAVNAGQVSQAEANAVVKRVLAEVFRDFLLAPDGTVSFDSRALAEPQGLTISYPHLVMELVLSATGEELVGAFLPDPDLTLRRLPEFARRVGVLGLTEEAMAIFAKINDMRSAQEISDPSPHGRELALRLLAAAVGAGLVEATPRVTEMQLDTTAAAEERSAGGGGWWKWLLAILLLGALLVAALFWQPWKGSGSAAGVGGPWGVAVDMGCQSAEMERIYRRQSSNRDAYRLVKFQNGDLPCYRLVWGHFPSKEMAERASGKLPEGVLARGFVAHVVNVESSSP